MTSLKIYAVVPAAGMSRRMGTQKLLLPYGCTTVIAHVVKQVLSAPVCGVVAVVSPDGAAVSDAASGAGATAVVNPDAEADMLDSVRCGVRSLPADCDGVLLALGDQPSVQPRLVANLIAALASRPDAIVVPNHGGKRGHPVLIASRWFEAILTCYDAVGVRGLLAEYGEHVVDVAIDDVRILEDIDDPDAYRRALDSAADT